MSEIESQAKGCDLEPENCGKNTKTIFPKKQ